MYRRRSQSCERQVREAQGQRAREPLDLRSLPGV
jgi:hypothetical protein